MKIIAPLALVAAAHAQFTSTCTQEVMDAMFECVKASGSKDMNVLLTLLSQPAGQSHFCYGDWAGCESIKKMAVTPVADCTYYLWKQSSINPSKVFTCPNPLPPREQPVDLCMANRFALSEYYSQLYTNTAQNSKNEHFVYNATSESLIAQSNGECLDAYKDDSGKFQLHTYKCDATNANQKWFLANNRIQHMSHHVCVTSSITQAGAVAGVAPCDWPSLIPLSQWFADCKTVPTNYVQIKTSRGKTLREWYSGLFAGDAKSDMNEVFAWDPATKQIKSASANQCLDVYPDASGKHQLHTYACDPTNGNQKWSIDGDKIQHATYNWLCLDIDPTYADGHAQVWQCTPNNDNQKFIVEKFSK